MRLFADLIGTLRPTFRIGRSSLDASAVTSPRVLGLPDKAGTVALVSDLEPLAAQIEALTEQVGDISAALDVINGEVI